jgi:hypothetical protein
LRDASGSPVANRLVTVSAGQTGLSLFPADGTALTNAAGEARISVSVPTGRVGGAGVVSALADASGVPVAATLDLSYAANTVQSRPRLDIGVLNGNGSAVSFIAIGAGNVVTARVLDAAGLPVINRRVVFSLAGAALATLNPPDGSALTDAFGNASVQITPVNAASAGAISVRADTTVGAFAVSASADIAVVATGTGSSVASIRLALFNSSGIVTNNVSTGSGNVLRATVLDSRRERCCFDTSYACLFQFCRRSDIGCFS